MKFPFIRKKVKNQDHPKTRRCPKCDEKIRYGAKKCKHCGSFLSSSANWYKARVTIGVIAAIISIIPFVINGYKTLTDDKSPNIVSTFIKTSHVQIIDALDPSLENIGNLEMLSVVLMVFNKSEYPAYLKKMTVTYEYDTLKMKLFLFPSEGIIKPNSMSRLEFGIPTPLLTRSGLMDKSDRINIIRKHINRDIDLRWYQASQDKKKWPFGSINFVNDVLKNGKCKVQFEFDSFKGEEVSEDFNNKEELLRSVLFWHISQAARKSKMIGSNND